MSPDDFKLRDARPRIDPDIVEKTLIKPETLAGLESLIAKAMAIDPSAYSVGTKHVALDVRAQVVELAKILAMVAQRMTLLDDQGRQRRGFTQAVEAAKAVADALSGSPQKPKSATVMAESQFLAGLDEINHSRPTRRRKRLPRFPRAR